MKQNTSKGIDIGKLLGIKEQKIDLAKIRDYIGYGAAIFAILFWALANNIPYAILCGLIAYKLLWLDRKKNKEKRK